MATRLYLRGTTNNTAGFTASELSTAMPVGTLNDAAVAARDLDPSAGASAESQDMNSLAQTADQDGYFRKFISAPLAGVNITAQTWTIALAVQESNGSANMRIVPIIYVLTASDTVRGFIIDQHATTLFAESPGGMTGFIRTPAGSAVSGVTSTDRLVLELWYHAVQAHALSYVDSTRWNGATDIVDNTANNDPAAYIETPQDGIFAAPAGPSFQLFKKRKIFVVRSWPR